jgi:predicted kinase
MSILYIPVGIPGCGKSTLALGLGPNAIISTDEIRGRLGDVNDQSKNDQVFAQFHFEIHTFLMGDKSVFARERLLGIAKQINDIAYDVQDLTKGEMVWPVQTHLLLFRNMAQALERNQKRERTVPDDVMLRMIEKYERAVTDIGSENYDYVTEVSAVR